MSEPTKEPFFLTYTRTDRQQRMQISTAAHLQKIHRQAEWIQYEVDPEWSRFCSFGPDDIGGPWEKLGVIRRKPRVDLLRVSPDVMDRMLKDYEQRVNSQDMPSRPLDMNNLYAIRIVEDSNLAPGSAIGFAAMKSLELMANHGVVPESRWPFPSTLRKYDNV